MKLTVTILSALTLCTAFGGPAGKAEPVAEGYPDWQGLIEKNYVSGRKITPSDLRQKVTVVVDVEPNPALMSNLSLAGNLAVLNGLCGWHVGDNWETRVLPRNVICVVSYHDKKDTQPIFDAMKPPKGNQDQDLAARLGYFRHVSVPIYCDVTFTGAPDTTGKRPYVYVIGPDGKDVAYQGTLDAAGVKQAIAAVRAEEKKLKAKPAWKQFFGFIEEPQFHPKFAEEIAKGKPLANLMKSLQKDIVGKDADKAKEAQILYDALQQTKSDLVMRIAMEARECPHRAYYDLQQLVKYWPGEKNKLKPIMGVINQIPDGKKLGDIFIKVMVYADPKFSPKNASDAKKIVAELNKYKVMLEKMKESKVVVIQNGAQLLDMQLDELISTMPMRVPST